MLVIDPIYNTLERMGTTAKLTRSHMEMFMFLFKHRNKVVTKGAILDHLYGLENEEPSAKVIDVFLCYLRKRLEPVGIRIRTVWGRGLMLEWNEEFKIINLKIIDEVEA